MPRLGCSVYYDTLTGAGRHFIDTRYLLRAMGLGVLATPLLRLAGIRDLLTNKLGEPVLKVCTCLHCRMTVVLHTHMVLVVLYTVQCMVRTQCVRTAVQSTCCVL
jgi:hypothetical protein